MSRHVLPLSWARCATSYDGVTTPVSGTNAANAPGVNFSTAGTADTDGTAVNVLNGQDFPAKRILFYVGGLSVNAGVGCALGDLLIDRAAGVGNPGSSWSSIWDDVVVGHAPVASAAAGLMAYRYEVYLNVPAGAALGFRAKSHNASIFTEGRISLASFGYPSQDVFAGYKVESLGNGANSNGVLVTPGNTGTFGSWTNIGSATSQRYGALIVGAQGDTSAALGTVGYYIELGIGSVKIPGMPRIYYCTTTAEIALRNGGFLGEWLPCNIPSGVQLQARATQTASGANTLGVVIHGLCS